MLAMLGAQDDEKPMLLRPGVVRKNFENRLAARTTATACIFTGRGTIRLRWRGLSVLTPSVSLEESILTVICVEGKLWYQYDGKSGMRSFGQPHTCAPLLNFLLQDVLSLMRIGSSTLEVSFNEGGRIVMRSDSDAEFESYSIYLNSGDIVVV